MPPLPCPAGFYGQLGHGDYESTESPKDLCIGYQQCIVSVRSSCAAGISSNKAAAK